MGTTCLAVFHPLCSTPQRGRLRDEALATAVCRWLWIFSTHSDSEKVPFWHSFVHYPPSPPLAKSSLSWPYSDTVVPERCLGDSWPSFGNSALLSDIKKYWKVGRVSGAGQCSGNQNLGHDTAGNRDSMGLGCFMLRLKRGLASLISLIDYCVHAFLSFLAGRKW